MTTELQEAPAIGTIEIAEDEQFQMPDDMIAHLYIHGVPYTLCGIHRRNDPHDQMHRNHGDAIKRAKKGDKACPVCGAKLCGECEVQMVANLEKMKEKLLSR